MRSPVRPETMWRCLCGHEPCDGLDCGVWLPGQQPRKKPAKKSPEELARIRAKAWATRRARSIEEQTNV